MVVLEVKNNGINKVSRIHPLGTMKFMAVHVIVDSLWTKVVDQETDQHRAAWLQSEHMTIITTTTTLLIEESLLSGQALCPVYVCMFYL